MQNFLHSKRQYVVPQKLLGSLFKYNLNKYKLCNAMSTNINLTRQLYGIKNKKLIQIQSLHSKNQSFRIYFPNLCNARNFSTSFTCRQPNNSSKSNKDGRKDDKRDTERIFILTKMGIWLFLMLLPIFLLPISVEKQTPIISWPEFINELLLKGQVQEIMIHPDRMQVVLKTGATYKGKSLDDLFVHIENTPVLSSIEDQIRAIEKRVGIKAEDGISIRYIQNNTILALSSLFSWMLLFITFYLLYRDPKIQKSLNNIIPFGKAKYTLVEPFLGKGVRFKDVAGLKEAKIEVMEFVDYLKNPEKYTKLGAKVPKGALLLGPPGCGKTLLAKAVATEANVPFLSMNGSEFTEVIGGLGAARVRDLFAEAKKRAPSIIYIDEIDAIGKKRSDSYVENSNSESERTLNQLLVEMDGMIAAKDVIILASTNRSEVLDKALLRCGRFDRHILIDLPTLKEREQIFEYHLQSLLLEGKPIQYSKYLAHLTPGFSGAEIANICNEAALHAASEKKVKVDNDDLMYAIDKVLGGTIKKSSTLTSSEKKTIVYHEAGHALAAWLLEHAKPLIKVTVVPRTNLRLGFSQYSDSNLKLQSSDYLFEYMCVLLGGRVAENIIFNKVSTGAQNDLEKVTEIAYRQVQQFGMSPSVGLVSFNKELTTTKNKKPYSKKLGSLMDAEVRRLIIDAYKKTEKLLQDNKDKLITLAETLLKKETLTYKDIEALIGPPPFGKKDLMELQEYNPDIE